MHMRKNFNLTIWIVGTASSRDYAAEQSQSRLEAAPTTGSQLGFAIMVLFQSPQMFHL
jgi:hypothetical protein